MNCRKFLMLGLILAFGSQLLAQQTGVSFLTYKSKEKNGNYEGPKTQLIKRKKKNLQSFYEDWQMKKLPIYLGNNNYEVLASCDQSLHFAICIDLSKVDNDRTNLITIEFESDILQIADSSYKILINQQIEKNEGDTSKVLFIDLMDHLERAYKVDKDMESDFCCPGDLEGKDDITGAFLCMMINSGLGGLKVYVKSGASDLGIFEITNLMHCKNCSVSNKIASNKFFNSSTTYSDNFGIEPRQFVTIYEEHKGSKMEPIWWLHENQSNFEIKGLDDVQNTEMRLRSNYLPYQKYQVLGEKSQLRIYFNRQSLAENIEFYGNISVEAQSGNGAIEVNPYSVVGKDQKAYGVNSRAIKEIASYFLRMMIEAKRGNSIFSTMPVSYNGMKTSNKSGIVEEEDAYVKYLFQETRLEIDRILAVMDGKSDTTDKGDLIEYSTNNLGNFNYSRIENCLVYAWNPNLSVFIEGIARYRKARLIEILQNYRGQLISWVQELTQDDEVESPEESLKPETIHRFKRSVAACLRYLNFIDESGIESRNAFLKLANLTSSDFSVILKQLEGSWIVLDKFSIVDNDKYNFDDTGNIEAKKLIAEMWKCHLSLKELSASSVELTNVLLENGYSTDFIRMDFLDRPVYEISRDMEEKFQINLNDVGFDELVWLIYEANTKTLLAHYDDYNSVINELAVLAGKDIYKSLVFATIDIEKSELEDGDFIEVNVMWYPDFESNDKDRTGYVLASAKFYIRKVGWHMDISETSTLIKRIDEELLPSNYPLSRSNFKPTAGATLMWSYHNTYRGWQDFKKHEFHTGTRVGNALRWFEPSLGMNVTYLDFDNDQTFELGFGPMLGLWRNKMFFTGGYNLMVEGQSPYYVGIGFSFSNIAETIGKHVEQNPSK